jgi:hypothetical protein
MNKYYIYAHSKPCGEVFYVGKGSGKRLFITSNRSDFWKRIASKYEYEVSIIEECLDEDTAFDREIFWIAHYKSIGQCVANFTNGGDGVRVGSRWWGEKISKSLIGKKCASGKESKSYKDLVCDEDLRKMYCDQGMSSIDISKVTNLSYTTICSRISYLGIQIRSPGRAKRKIVCTTDGACFDSIADASKFYGLRRELVNKVLSGRYHTTGGMSFSYKEESHHE